MKVKHAPIVTVTEALSLLGIRKSSLLLLEREAGIPEFQGRDGYTAGQMRRLFDAVRRILGRNKAD